MPIMVTKIKVHEALATHDGKRENPHLLPVKPTENGSILRRFVIDANTAPDGAFIEESNVLNPPDNPGRAINYQLEHREPAQLAVR